MSMQTLPVRRLYNVLTTSTVTVAAGVVTIDGLLPFESSGVLLSNCQRLCTTACTLQITTVTPTVPSAPCECPYVWEMAIIMNGCSFDSTNRFFPDTKFYNYVDPTGALPTVNNIVASVVAQINANTYSKVTAAAVGSVGSYTAITLTEKDCGTTINGTCGFTVTFSSGTQATGTAHLEPTLGPVQMGREFAILPGYEFMQPAALVVPGATYCKYYLKVRPMGAVYDPHVINADTTPWIEYELYVRSDLSNFFSAWDTKLANEIQCLGATLDPAD